jgi:hypothetical protein
VLDDHPVDPNEPVKYKDGQYTGRNSGSVTLAFHDMGIGGFMVPRPSGSELTLQRVLIMLHEAFEQYSVTNNCVKNTSAYIIRHIVLNYSKFTMMTGKKSARWPLSSTARQLALSSIYVASEACGVAPPAELILYFKDEASPVLYRVQYFAKKVLGLKPQVGTAVKAKALISYIVSALELPKDVAERAIRLVDALGDNVVFFNPVNLAAGAVYYVTRGMEPPVSMRAIGSVVHAQEATVSSAYKRILSFIPQ